MGVAYSLWQQAESSMFRGGHLGANEPTVALKCFFFSEEAP